MQPWIEAYFQRIRYEGSPKADIETLLALHQAHLTSVPFENLNIQRGIPLSLKLDDLIAKVISNRRGGFCYELNYLFGSMLIELGYDTTFLSASVYDAEGIPGDEFDHMNLMVVLEEPWLLDVGFGGSSFLNPLKLDLRSVQHDPAGSYQIVQDNINYSLIHSIDQENYQGLYDFTLAPRSITDFYDQCHMKQTDPGSHFVNRKICTMATENGRKSLLNDEFTTRIGLDKETIKIVDQQMEDELLSIHFDIKF